jgi:hypothetical protein
MRSCPGHLERSKSRCIVGCLDARHGHPDVGSDAAGIQSDSVESCEAVKKLKGDCIQTSLGQKVVKHKASQKGRLAPLIWPRPAEGLADRALFCFFRATSAEQS